MIALFPGQGSQFVGMGKDLFDNFSYVREIFEEAADATKVNLKKLCFDGPESDLKLTENTQPCLLTTSIAAFRVAEKELGFRPNVAAGHSLGEYSALVACGCISLSTAAFWVKARGKAMQNAVPEGQGSMAALMGADEDLAILLCEVATEKAKSNRESGQVEFQYDVEALVQPANYNAPLQIVIAGSQDALDCAKDLTKLEERFSKIKVIPLAVSAPFHSALMTKAKEKMIEVFDDTSKNDKPGKLKFPYVPNRTAQLNYEPGVVLDLLTEQIDHPVFWQQSIQNLIIAKETKAVEFGPGKVLQGLGKRIAKGVNRTLEIETLGLASDIKIVESFIK